MPSSATYAGTGYEWSPALRYARPSDCATWLSNSRWTRAHAAIACATSVPASASRKRSGASERSARRASVRAQLHRARNKGVTVTQWSAERAENCPVLGQLLGEWLRGLGLPPLHFLIETDTIALTRDRRIFVAARRDVAVAYLVASPVPARKGWLIEQIV